MIDPVEIAKWAAVVFVAGVIAQVARGLTKGCLGRFCWWKKITTENETETRETRPLTEVEAELEKERVKSREKLEKKRLKIEKKRVKEEGKRLEDM